MCNPNTLQQKIAELTNDGDVILRFLTETVQAKTPGVKVHHQLEASRQLTRLANLTPSPSTGEGRDGGDAPACTQPANEPADAQDHSTHNSEPNTHNSKLTTDNSPVTYLDILNYNLAQLIRSETAEGHTITEFLLETLTGRDSAFTPNKFKIKPDDRMAAAREIINRGFGRFGRRRKLIDDAEEANDYDTLHTDLAKRLRQYSEQGSQAILFLLDVMRNDFPDEQYTRRHRVSAAQELLRRGWDTNYDRIKMEHLMDYWRDQHDAVLSVGQKKHLAGLHTFADEYDQYDSTDYEPIAKQLHAQQDRESEARKQEKQEESRTTTPLPPQGEGWEGGEADKTSSPSMPVKEPADAQARPTENSQLRTQDSPDCHYEPLSPEDQALFDYYTLIESGDYKEGEIQPRPVTETMRLAHEATLKWMRETTAKEGVPLLPNPLSGTFVHPNARSP